MFPFARFLPLLSLLLVLAAGYALGLHRELSWDALAARQAGLHALVAARPAAAGLSFLAVYIAAAAVSFPGTVVLTVAGGLLFGTLPGAALTVLAATTGSTIVFLVARTTLGTLLAARAGPFLDRFRAGLRRDAFSYILAMRLLPVIPFWVVNLVTAVLGVRLAPFMLGTFLGIIPATTVLSGIGAGIGSVLMAGGRPDFRVMLSPPVLLPLLGLAVLALAPVLWRVWRQRGVRHG